MMTLAGHKPGFAPGNATAGMGERERCYREVFMHASDALFVIDIGDRGQFVFDTLNPAAEEAFQVQHAALCGTSFDAIDEAANSGDTGTTLGRIRLHCEECLRTGMPVEFEASLALQPADAASAAEFQVRLIPLADDRGIERIIGLGHDITLRKRMERDLRQSRTLLQELSIHHQDAREGERKHIARELHEELGQLLFALRMEVSALPLQFGDALPQLREKSFTMLSLLDEGIHELRNIVTALRPISLDAGVAAALEWLTRDFSQHTGIRGELHLPEDGVALAEDDAIAVFRIVQEALFNVARHSKAHRVDIGLERTDGRWRLTIGDDGRGFDAGRRPKRSFGILAMRERALAMGGELDIASIPGAGTVVALSFPARTS